MAQQRTFLTRIGYHWTCVAPATILSDDSLKDENNTPLPSLRTEASSDGLCYLQLVRVASSGDLYIARVAASPDDLCSHALTVFFTETQLRSALPWDCRVQGKSSKCILKLLHAHAAEIQPALQTCERAQEEPLFQEEEPLVPLGHVTVSQACLSSHFGTSGHDVIQDTRKHNVSKNVRLVHVQQSLLLAVLHALTSQMRRASDVAQKNLLQARCALIAQVRQWQKQTQQRVVNPVPFFDTQAQQLFWNLSLVGPSSFLS